MTEENTKYDDALAELERSQNYKAYYDQAIQNYNMKQNTQKYMGNMLANQGLNNTGYGSSMHAGIGNTAMNLYAQNAQNYAQAEAKTTSDAYSRYMQNQTERDNQLVTLLSNSNGKTMSDTFMKNYGYIDDNGEYTDAWNNLDDERKSYIKSVYDMYSTEEENLDDKYTFYSMDELSNSTFQSYSDDGDDQGVKNFSEQFSKGSYTTLKHYVNNKKFNNGDVICLNDTGYANDTTYLLYQDGKVRYISKEEYESSKGEKYKIKNKEISKL